MPLKKLSIQNERKNYSDFIDENVYMKWDNIWIIFNKYTLHWINLKMSASQMGLHVFDTQAINANSMVKNLKNNTSYALSRRRKRILPYMHIFSIFRRSSAQSADRRTEAEADKNTRCVRTYACVGEVQNIHKPKELAWRYNVQTIYILQLCASQPQHAWKREARVFDTFRQGWRREVDC